MLGLRSGKVVVKAGADDRFGTEKDALIKDKEGDI